MKIITLAAPTVVNTNPLGLGSGELRNPVEGDLTVSDKEAQRLKDNNLLARDPVEPSEPEIVSVDHAADLKGKTAAQLKPIALKEGVALNDATSAEDISALIVAHRTKEA